ncbi:MAG: DUF305 domain-containing protein [Actinomycetota bacterium]|jgi:uncharacterized protein (DUF305 family)|nr:DUF305 domain-containing protein [Actinomycetota bacterium]
MQYKHALWATALALALVLTGCGNNATTDPSADTQGGEAAFNEADVAFAQGMIVHHQQAIDMAVLGQDNAASPEVRQLAADIEAAQGPEIATMTQWLEAWGEDVPEADSGMDDSMPGMMSEEDMEQLETNSGSEFDQMFLTMMIEHHQGAVDMAQADQAEGENADAVALAEQIESDQTAEIETMEGLLDS